MTALILILAIVLSSLPAQAALTVGTVGQSPDGVGLTTTSWSHAVQLGSNLTLFVCVLSRGATEADVTTPTVSLSTGGTASRIRLDTRTNGGVVFHTELWKIVNPPAGTGTITVSANAATTYLRGFSMDYSGVDLSAPTEADAGNSGSGTGLSVSLSSLTANAVVLDCALGRADTVMSVGAGQTVRAASINSVPDTFGMSTADKATPGSETMDWTQATATDWVMSAAVIKPLTSPSGNAAILTWQPVITDTNGNFTTVTSYKLYRLLGPCGGAGSVSFLANAGTSTLYVDSTIPANPIGASYEVSAVNSVGEGAHSVRVCKSFDNPPPTVTGVSLTAQGTTALTASWSATVDDFGIDHYLFESSPSGCTTWTQVYSGTATTFQLTGLAAGTTRCIRGRAVDTAGQLSQQYSATVQATTATSILPTITTITTSGTGATITGTEDAGNPAAAIRVEYGDNAGTAYVSTTVPIAQFPGWPSSASYSFQWPAGTQWACVHARDAGGNEDPVNYRCNTVTPAADSTPPVLSNAHPSGSLAPGVTDVTMSLTTNESATCKYDNAAGTAYAAMPFTFSSTGGTQHATTFAGLSPGGYSRFVRCRDAALNANTSDLTISWTIVATPPPADTTAPILSNGNPTGTLISGTTSALLSLTTNESAMCKYGLTPSTAYDAIANTFSTTGNLQHTQSVVVVDGGTYRFYVRCRDAALNVSADFILTFQVATPPPPAADSTPPVLSAGTPIGILPLGTTTSTLTVVTNEPATCKYGTVANTAYNSMASTFASTGGTLHTQGLTGLTDGVSRTYYLRCQDLSANLNSTTSDYVIAFTVAQDTTAPQPVTGLTGSVLSDTSVSLSWAAGQDNVGVVRYVIRQATGPSCSSYSVAGNSVLLSLTISGLTAATEYCFTAEGVDAAGLAGTPSTPLHVTTLAAADVTAPDQATGLTATVHIFPLRVELAFNTPTDTAPGQVASSVIRRCVDSDCPSTMSIIGSTVGSAASFRDETVSGGHTYGYTVTVIDLANNQATASSLASVVVPSIDTTAPTAPSGCAAVATAFNEITVTCATLSTDAVGVIRYSLEMAEESGSFGQVLSPTTPSYTDRTVLPSTTRRYRLTAMDAAGNVSAYSDVVSATTPDTPAGTKLGVCPCENRRF